MAFLRRQSSYHEPTKLIGGPDMVLTGMRSTIITNSGVMRKGDVVAVTAAAAGNGIVVRRYNSAGDAIVGVCIGFGQANGRSVAFDAATNDTVTVASNNETVAKIYAIIDVTHRAVYSALVTGTIHTTVAAGFGAWFDPNTGANAGAVLESSGTRTPATGHGRGLACVGVDQEDTTRMLVVILEDVVNGAGA